LSNRNQDFSPTRCADDHLRIVPQLPLPNIEQNVILSLDMFAPTPPQVNQDKEESDQISPCLLLLQRNDSTELTCCVYSNFESAKRDAVGI